MKANEIQIGDWLYYKGQFNTFPFKVESITKKKVGYHAEPGDNRIYYLRLNEVQAIPLTPKILEWNGFVHYDLTDFWMWKKESFEPVHLDKYDKDGWRLRINCDNIPCECKYVHQLQHALRLCGIEKEIEL